jgi:hypothetical protein
MNDTSDPMQRLEQVAGDAGKSTTSHSFLNPNEALVILTEVQQLRAMVQELRQLLPSA